MSPETVLPRLAGALRPGGVLAAIALPRLDLPRELPAEAAAAIGYRLLGAAFSPPSGLPVAGAGYGRRSPVTPSCR